MWAVSAALQLQPCCHMPPCDPRAPAKPHAALLRRLANRLRTVLAEAERAALDQTLATLAPLFDLRSTHPADSALAGDGGAPAGLADVPAATSAAVAAGHSVIEEQAAAGCERAEALAQAAGDSAAQLVAAAPAAGAAGPESAQHADHGQPPAAGPVGEPAPAAPAAAKALTALHADGVRSLAELCSLCLERLLALSRSLSAFYRYGKPADDHITWPASCEATGLLLRAQALRMLEDLQALAAAYGAALSQTGQAASARCKRVQRSVCVDCLGASSCRQGLSRVSRLKIAGQQLFPCSSHVAFPALCRPS